MLEFTVFLDGDVELLGDISWVLAAVLVRGKRVEMIRTQLFFEQAFVRRPGLLMKQQKMLYYRHHYNHYHHYRHRRRLHCRCSLSLSSSLSLSLLLSSSSSSSLLLTLLFERFSIECRKTKKPNLLL